MARGRKPKPGGLRPDQRKAGKILQDQSDREVPPMPDPNKWLMPPPGEDPDEYEVDWPEPVKDWWDDIWTSPMSSEFENSDIHGLYLACFYLTEGLNPWSKVSDRLKALGSFEATIKKYGLTPADRESLRWSVAQGEEAQARTNRARAPKDETSEPKKTKGQQRQDNIVQLYSQFSG